MAAAAPQRMARHKCHKLTAHLNRVCVEKGACFHTGGAGVHGKTRGTAQGPRVTLQSAPGWVAILAAVLAAGSILPTHTVTWGSCEGRQRGPPLGVLLFRLQPPGWEQPVPKAPVEWGQRALGVFLHTFLISFAESIYRRGARRWRKLYRANGHLFQAKRFNRVSAAALGFGLVGCRLLYTVCPVLCA